MFEIFAAHELLGLIGYHCGHLLHLRFGACS